MGLRWGLQPAGRRLCQPGGVLYTQPLGLPLLHSSPLHAKPLRRATKRNPHLAAMPPPLRGENYRGQIPGGLNCRVGLLTVERILCAEPLTVSRPSEQPGLGRTVQQLPGTLLMRSCTHRHQPVRLVAHIAYALRLFDRTAAELPSLLRPAKPGLLPNCQAAGYPLQQIGLYSHYETLISGLLKLSDVFYFTRVIAPFLGLTSQSLKRLPC